MTRPAAASAAAASLLAVLLCAPSPAQVPDAQTLVRELGGAYATTRADPPLASHGDIARRVEKVLRRQSSLLVRQLRSWDRDPRAALLTDGRFNEAGIRPNAHTAYGLAVLARTLDDDGARRHALKILRFLLPTHASWKDQWQSALWATSAGQAAWLLWDDLDDREKQLAARMICDEADRFVDAAPPAQVSRDTKAEENAWNSQALALAFNMFPRHPSRARYGDAAVRWHLSSFATSKDLASDRVIDGKPLREWLAGCGANLHDDYTLENHDRVHPDYMSSIRTIATQKLFYDWAGNPPPQSLAFNVPQIYANLKRLTFPDGGFVYPNGQDWHLHRNADWFDTHAVMSTLFDDAQAARLLRICLETTEKMLARSHDGPIYVSDETIFASSQAMLLELFADAYLLLRASGERAAPVDERQLWRDLAGVRRFDAGRFFVARTERSVATFSWGGQVMGMVLPLQKDLLLTPNVRGLIGVVEGETPVVKDWRINEWADRFLAVSGRLDRAGGALEQRFAFIALADGRAVYADLVRATADEHPKFSGGTIGVLNDRHWVYHDGTRVLTWADGEHIFDANADVDVVRDLASPWYNLDSILGIVCLHATGKQAYHEKPTGAAGRREQLFHLNADSRLPAACAIVFYPARDAAGTRDAAARCRLVPGTDPRRFSIVLDDGSHLDFDLENHRVKMP